MFDRHTIFRLTVFALSLASFGCSDEGSPRGPAESLGADQAPALARGDFLFSCYIYNVYRGPGNEGYVSAVAGQEWTGFSSGLVVRYLPDTPSACANYQVPVSGNPRTDRGPEADVGAGNIVIACQDRPNRITGSISTDVICGGPFDDVITGGKSADFANGMAGNDWVRGGEGRDLVRGGRGSDTLNGDVDIDCVLGDLGFDALSGGPQANDTCDPGGSDADGATSAADCERVGAATGSCDVHVAPANWNLDYRD